MRVRPLGLLVLAIACAPACGKSQVSEPEIAWLAHTDAACRAAAEQHEPPLFFLSASWDIAAKELERTIFIDPEVRRIVRQDFVPLRVDRTNTWMEEEGAAPPDELREVDEAVRRFKPYASKYGTVLVTGPDCTTELYRFDYTYDPRRFAAELRSTAARAR